MGETIPDASLSTPRAADDEPREARRARRRGKTRKTRRPTKKAERLDVGRARARRAPTLFLHRNSNSIRPSSDDVRRRATRPRAPRPRARSTRRLFFSRFSRVSPARQRSRRHSAFPLRTRSTSARTAASVSAISRFVSTMKSARSRFFSSGTCRARMLSNFSGVMPGLARALSRAARRRRRCSPPSRRRRCLRSPSRTGEGCL